MEKTIVIDGKKVTFKSTAATPLRYKNQFGKDFFVDIMKLSSLDGLNSKKIDMKKIEKIDFEIFYNIIWVLAKTADKKIPDPITWLDKFDEFPLFEIIPELQDLILASIKTKKKIENTNGNSGSLTTELFLYLCKKVDLNFSELEEMTIGMCMDYMDEWIARNNSSGEESKQARKATQADFDNF